MTRQSVLLGSFSGLFLVGCAVTAFLFLGRPAQSLTVPSGLDPIEWPTDNSYSKAKADLGKLLFFDPRLSADGTVSCASCHSPAHAFSEPNEVSIGIHGQRGRRNAPAILNAAYDMQFFWDGRAGTLEEQSGGPIRNPVEMGSSPELAIAHIRTVSGYAREFDRAFGSPEITWPRLTQAIGTFERTLVSGNAPYDRYQAGDKSAMSSQQVRGMKVFRESRCTTCHSAPFFTNGTFANLGVGLDRPHPDLGRYEITRDDHDWGAFKTPSLRNVAETAPYMHDGSVKTLEAVVDLYDRGGVPNRNLDNRIRPLHLTAEQKQDLVAFLNALSGEGWQTHAPERLPQ
jgi:cytochrome c peroxidase